jgi:adenylosuccinate synthase
MKTYVVVDLGYGDSGKGTTVDSLVRQTGAKVVVRFNGGAQAGHNVVTPGGDHHTFSQWGAGHFAGARTILSRHVVINPLAALSEAEHLVSVGMSNPFAALTVDGMCLVTTPYHQAMNRIRELLRRDRRHGSVGVGVGETVCYAAKWRTEALRAYDLADPVTLTKKVERLRERIASDVAMLNIDHENDAVANEMQIFLPDYTASIIKQCQQYARLTEIREIHALPEGPVVFEGAQGVLLDQWYGFHPYTSWSTCTSENARLLLREWRVDEPPVVLGVLRAYAVRHGPGPMVSEHPGLAYRIKELFNVANPWQGPVRMGWLDLVASRYAIEVDGHIDHLVVTCLDQLANVTDWRVCSGYDLGDGVFNRLPVIGGHDLDYQGQLTERLMRTKPVLQMTGSGPSFARRTDYHLQTIEDELNARVVGISTGPTCHDKRWLLGYDSPTCDHTRY